MLQMKITVIAEDVQHKPWREEAMTLVVNAHGGLLKMKMDGPCARPGWATQTSASPCAW